MCREYALPSTGGLDTRKILRGDTWKFLADARLFERQQPLPVGIEYYGRPRLYYP